MRRDFLLYALAGLAAGLIVAVVLLWAYGPR